MAWSLDETATARTWRCLTAALRVLPDFLVIGAQRCGTTSLFRCLLHHPDMRAPSQKEVHFFDYGWPKGAGWYRTHFPHRWHMCATARTGEASPYYLFHPQAPERAHAVVPGAKLIVLLRHPVDRAFSHYQLERSLGRETLTFEEALVKEAERIATGPSANPGPIDPHRDFSYCARGRYLEQLQGWRKHFPADSLLVLNSERFFREPRKQVAHVCTHLGLDQARLLDGAEWSKPHNRLDYKAMKPQTRARLLAEFRPHNEALFEYLGERWDWDV